MTKAPLLLRLVAGILLGIAGLLLFADTVGWWSVYKSTTEIDSGRLLETRYEMIAEGKTPPSPDSETTEEIRRLLGAALAHDPLSATPLFQWALVTEGDTEAAIEAVRRGKRSVSARILKLEQSISAGEIEKTVSELLILTRLDPDNRSSYIKTLARVVTVPAGLSVLETYLENSPAWTAELVEEMLELVDEGAPLAFIIDVSRSDRIAQQKVLNWLIARGAHDQAILAWFEFAGQEVIAQGWPVASEFATAAAPYPFNWGVRSAVAQRREYGLLVTHDGRSRRVIADQVMALGPGAYELNVLLKSAVDPLKSPIMVTTTCLPKRTAPLVKLELVNAARAETTLNSPFSVPQQGCALQRLEIIGLQGAYPSRTRVRIGAVHIEKRAALQPGGDR